MPECEYCDGAQCSCPVLNFTAQPVNATAESPPDALLQAAEAATEAFKIAFLAAAEAMPRPPIVFAKLADAASRTTSGARLQKITLRRTPTRVSTAISAMLQSAPCTRARAHGSSPRRSAAALLTLAGGQCAALSECTAMPNV